MKGLGNAAGPLPCFGRFGLIGCFISMVTASSVNGKIIFQTKDLWVLLFCRDLTVKAEKVGSRAAWDGKVDHSGAPVCLWLLGLRAY